VDAALDETNVERFLRVLRDFTAQTQFCIVTHHKRTMAECAVLYGITMQRRGVSSRIAVSLHEVDGFPRAPLRRPEPIRRSSSASQAKRRSGSEGRGARPLSAAPVHPAPAAAASDRA
jgi:chromosome segregation protein